MTKMQYKLNLSCLLMIVIVLLLARCADCQEKPKPDWNYRASQAVLFGGPVLDWISSAPSDNTREANPMMPNNRMAQAAIMGATTGLVYFITRSVYHRNRKAAIIGNYAFGAAHFGAAGWNFHLEMRLK
jgi:hypothetical protein